VISGRDPARSSAQRRKASALSLHADVRGVTQTIRQLRRVVLDVAEVQEQVLGLIPSSTGAG